MPEVAAVDEEAKRAEEVDDCLSPARIASFELPPSTTLPLPTEVFRIRPPVDLSGDLVGCIECNQTSIAVDHDAVRLLQQEGLTKYALQLARQFSVSFEKLGGRDKVLHTFSHQCLHNHPNLRMATTSELEQELFEPPDDVWQLLTDAHCHPTDDPRPWCQIDVLTGKLKDVKIGRICAMSTSSADQVYVSQLANDLPERIVPAFGYHPWFSHKIVVQDPSTGLVPPAESHYRKVLGKDGRSIDELAALVKHLEQPRALHEVIGEVKRNLLAHPNALLGEVGIDRVFRLPKDPKGWSREPDEESSMESDHEQTLGQRKRPLSNLTPSIEHQLIVVKAQIAVAIELGRSVSLHSVRAGGALMQLFDELSKEFPGDRYAYMSKRERKRLRRNATYTNSSDGEEAAAVVAKPSFDQINVDLHSCTLSAEMISQLQKKYPNIYVSFSLAINARQRDIHAQLRACDPRRLLVESDWHSAEDLGSRCWTMLRLATDVIGAPLARDEGERGQPSDDYRHAAAYIHENWLRFAKQSG